MQERIWPGAYRAIASGLELTGKPALLTVGRDRDPAELGPRTARLRIERYVPQAVVLPHAIAMLSHGGHNTMLGGLSHGLPLVTVPFFADQPENAARAAAAGASVTISPEDLTPVNVAEAVSQALTDPGFAAGAHAIQKEIASMPSAADVAGAIEDSLLAQ